MAQLPLDLHLHPEPTLRLLPPPLLPNKVGAHWGSPHDDAPAVSRLLSMSGRGATLQTAACCTFPLQSPPLERSRSKGLERLDSSSFSGGSPVSRAWSLPAAIPAAAQCPAARDLRAAGSASARDLRGSLAAARASLRAEQRARAEAEAAAARVAGVHAAELERLRRELAQAQNRAGRLEMNNKTLVAELEGARSQLPAMEVRGELQFRGSCQRMVVPAHG